MARSLKTIRWENIRGPRALGAFTLGTALGAGLFPIAPGTMGTILAIPVAYFTAGWETWARVALWLGLFVIGTWSAKVCDEVLESSDNSRIVIDETVGFGITAWTVGTNFMGLAVAFVLFRIFDILKPPPIRQVDRWSKKMAAQETGMAPWWGGFGVMIDDVMAAVQALLIVMLLQHFGVLAS